MKIVAFCIISLFFFLFILPNPSFAATFYDTNPPSGPNYSVVPASFCAGPPECANSENPNNCGLATCSGGRAWTKYRLTCLYDDLEDRYDSYYQQTDEIVYSIGDKCVAGEFGLRSSSCTNIMSSSMYKTCCSFGTPSFVNPSSCVQFEGDTINPPWEGRCPAGYQREVFCGTGTGVPCGQSACGPIASVTCSQTREYNQCGGTCNGITYPSNHTIHVIENQCTDNTTQYQCSDLGVLAGQCGNPSVTPSCSVSWNISNTNPSTNSTVIADVTGTSISNASWTNVAYSLDGGGWNTNVQVTSTSIPTFRFSVPSGSANPHSLRFAIGNGSTVCSPTSSFITQAPSQNDAATCTALSFNSQNITASGNYTATVIMRNDGDTTWISSGSFPYRLGAQQPQDDPNWGTSSGADSGKGTRPTRVNLSSQVPPGSSNTFTFGVTAPDTAGTYRFSWQMLREGIQWFGGICQPNITVQPPIFTFTPSCTGTVTNAQNRTIRWDATVNPTSPPAGSYAYSWSGDASGTTPSVTQTYATAGTKNAKVAVSYSGISKDANCQATIIPPAAPTVSLTTNPISIANNASSTLSWTTTSCTTANSCSCSASGDWSGSKSISGGSQSTGNLTGPANYTYTLTCTNSNGTSLRSTANVSVSGVSGAICTPETDSAFCSRLGKNCGTVSGTDNCGGTRTVTSCGTCSGSQTCGGGGTVNVCGGGSCTAETDSAFCSRLGKNCGSVTASDNCGTIKTVSCGTTCPSGQTCGGGGTVNVCGGSSSLSGTSPWIQTTGGDVHSNTNINTPGGP